MGLFWSIIIALLLSQLSKAPETLQTPHKKQIPYPFYAIGVYIEPIVQYAERIILELKRD